MQGRSSQANRECTLPEGGQKAKTCSNLYLTYIKVVLAMINRIEYATQHETTTQYLK
jgi:hypothetical protein